MPEVCEDTVASAATPTPARLSVKIPAESRAVQAVALHHAASPVQRLLLLLALVAAMLLVPLVQGVGAGAEETVTHPDMAARQLTALAMTEVQALVAPR